MYWYGILGVLAAFGMFSALWAAFGWLLPKDKGCVLVCWGQPDEGTRAWIGWLRGLGLLDAPLLVISEAEDGREDWEICTGEALLSRLEWEKNRFDGTGNGDHSGNHQCGGVPEL